jgi:hypothetical protein
VIHDGEDGPYAIAADERYLYWVSRAGLRRAPLDGGAPVTLAPVSAEVRGLTPAGEYLYFYQGGLDGPEGIARVPREGGDSEWVADADNPQSLIANADHVVWAEWGDDSNTGRLWRAGLDGSAPIALAEGLASPRALAFHGEQLYFENGNLSDCSGRDPATCIATGFFRLSTSSGEPERVVATAVASNPVWNEGAMYWLAGDPRATDVVVLAPGGAPQPIAEMLMDSPFDASGTLLFDSEAIYWDTGSRVLRMAFATRIVERLVIGLSINSMALRRDRVYAAEGDGRILSIATDGSAYDPTVEPITGPCPAPVGDAAELALTPRAQPNLELLAFELEPEHVVASQATYERLVSDVTASIALDPTLAEVSYFAPHDGQRLQLQWTEATRRAFEEGQYTAWDCLNEAYGLRSFSSTVTSVNLQLRGIYNLPLVLERYLQLPGVTGGNKGSVLDDGPTICVARTGDRYEYVFDHTGGGCAGRCRQHRAHHIASDASGQVTELAVWDSTTGTPVPTWFTDICEFVPVFGP